MDVLTDRGLRGAGRVLGLLVGAFGYRIAWSYASALKAPAVPIGILGFVIGFSITWLFFMGIRWIIRGYQRRKGGQE